MGFRNVLTVSWILLSTSDCQNPIDNSPSIFRPTECAAPFCDCCVTHDCNTCNGTCMEGIFGGNCFNKCPDRCLSCFDYGASNSNYKSYGYCTECRPGYYSVLPNYFQCNYNCPAWCVSCQSATQCHSCNKGYYLVPTTSEYDQCMACPSSCVACTSSISCTVCTAGFEGNACENCEAGFYGEHCNTSCPDGCKDNICNKSSGNCINCKSGFTSVSCDKCYAGWYGQHCDQECPENCKDSECNRIDSNCTYGCVDNFNGDTCDKCKAGKYGADCINDCPVNCYLDICDSDSGYCSRCTANFKGVACDDCNDGWYGTDCSLRCQRNCKGTVCKRDSGECVECNDGFYGLNCIKSCSLRCNGTTCNRNGFCDQGCQNGYSGDRCCVLGNNCLECSSNNICSECIVGKYGKTCEWECPVCCEGGTCNKADGSCPKSSNQVSDPVPAGAIAGGVVGVAMVIGTTVVLVVYLMKRRQGQKEQKSLIYYNVSDTTYQENRGVVTSCDAEFQITELQQENERLKEETRLLKEDNNRLKGKNQDPQSHYISLDEETKEEITYEELGN